MCLGHVENSRTNLLQLASVLEILQLGKAENLCHFPIGNRELPPIV